MAYTFKSLQDEVLNYGFNDATYRLRVQTWLNEAQHIACRRVPIRELRQTYSFPLVFGTATYALPTNFASAESITDIINQRALAGMDLGWLDLQAPTSGAPTNYSLDQSGITFFPTPNATSSTWVQMRYFLDPVDMASDGDVPSLPAAHQHILLSYAISRGYRSEDDPEQAQMFMGDFERGLDQMSADRRGEVKDGSKQVPGMWRQRHPVRT